MEKVFTTLLFRYYFNWRMMNTIRAPNNTRWDYDKGWIGFRHKDCYLLRYMWISLTIHFNNKTL